MPPEWVISSNEISIFTSSFPAGCLGSVDQTGHHIDQSVPVCLWTSRYDQSTKTGGTSLTGPELMSVSDVFSIGNIYYMVIIVKIYTRRNFDFSLLESTFFLLNNRRLTFRAGVTNSNEQRASADSVSPLGGVISSEV